MKGLLVAAGLLAVSTSTMAMDLNRSGLVSEVGLSVTSTDFVNNENAGYKGYVLSGDFTYNENLVGKVAYHDYREGEPGIVDSDGYELNIGYQAAVYDDYWVKATVGYADFESDTGDSYDANTVAVSGFNELYPNVMVELGVEYWNADSGSEFDAMVSTDYEVNDNFTIGLYHRAIIKESGFKVSWKF